MECPGLRERILSLQRQITGDPDCAFSKSAQRMTCPPLQNRTRDTGAGRQQVLDAPGAEDESSLQVDGLCDSEVEIRPPFLRISRPFGAPMFVKRSELWLGSKRHSGALDLRRSTTLGKEKDMERQCVFAFLVCVLSANMAHAQTGLNMGAPILFATVGQGREILTTRDEFVQAMSPFDRAARMKTSREISEKEFLEFVGGNVLEWTPVEKERATSACLEIQTRFEALSLPFPKPVFLVKTTGDEEGDASYTRGNAIVLPDSEVAGPVAKTRKTICHELFHIMSRRNPELRDRLYASIGFVKCDEVEFPAELKSRKITNPDAPANNHCILVKLEGKEYWAIPILFSRAEKYDTARGGEFFEYLQMQFLVAERQNNGADEKPVYRDRDIKRVGLQSLSGFFEQVGKNTKYIIHPEEILADNFALLVLEDRQALSPAIIRKMKEILKEKWRVGLGAPADNQKPKMQGKLIRPSPGIVRIIPEVESRKPIPSLPGRALRPRG